MVATTVTPMKIYHVSGQQPAHYGLDRGDAGTQQEMHMVRDNDPGKAVCFRIGNNNAKAFKELII